MPARIFGRWLLHSLASRLVLLSVVFVAVPILIYDQFRAADEEAQSLLLQTAQEQGEVIARALEPILETADAAVLPRLGAELGRFADEHTRLKLLLRPAALASGAAGGGADAFFYVGAAPSAEGIDLDEERRQLMDQGILHRLSATCSGNQPLAIRVIRPSGGLEVLTSITTTNSPFGCWALVTAHSTAAYLGTSIGQPYWRTPVVQAAALIYVGMAAMILVLFLSIWRNLNRFGRLAHDIRTGDNGTGTFADQNTVPELASVAQNFDRLVETLHQSADSLRRAAEDNAHAFKTPIAVIRQSLEPLMRIVPSDDGRGQRALTMIERSIERLDGLVSFARRMDEAAADVLEPPRKRINLSALVERMVEAYQPITTERRIALAARVAPTLVVRAGEDLLETVVENIIENALSFSPAGGTVRLRLARLGETVAELTLEDEGPGVEPANLSRIFERYYSHRPGQPTQPAAGEEPHFGIGLWIVRRNVEAVGGTVAAENRPEGGLRVRIRLPVVG